VFLTEVESVAREVATLRRGLSRWMSDERVIAPLILRPTRSWPRREPLGAVLVIGPWNYPVNLVHVPLVATLVAGNCAVAQPSEQAPATSALIVELSHRYLDAVRLLSAKAKAR
jgi:aldehyde dehydrogenase (NAD+)